MVEDQDRQRSGPIPLPSSSAQRRWRPWLVTVAVVFCLLLLYAFTRPATVNQARNAAPPTWGRLTLAQVALRASGQAGETRPRDALWLRTQRSAALRVLTGTTSDNYEAEFLVALQGHFQLGPGTEDRLAGSLASGPNLIILVRAFDGVVDGRTVLSRLPGIGVLGVERPLRLFFL